jgi:2-methylaconitate cis-trans-isomerase PrpF
MKLVLLLTSALALATTGAMAYPAASYPAGVSRAHIVHAEKVTAEVRIRHPHGPLVTDPDWNVRHNNLINQASQ